MPPKSKNVLKRPAAVKSSPPSIKKRKAKEPVEVESEEPEEDEDVEEEGEEEHQEADGTETAPSASSPYSTRGTITELVQNSSAEPAPGRTVHVVITNAASPTRHAASDHDRSTPSKGKDASAKPNSPAGTASISPERPGVETQVSQSDGRFKVLYRPPLKGAALPVEEGLVALRGARKFCDTAVVSGETRVSAHRAVLAAASAELADRLEAQPDEVNVGDVTSETVDILVRFAYGEIRAETYRPSSHDVSAEVLELAHGLKLQRLVELCGIRMVEDVNTTNAVERIQMCEKYGLPDVRAAIVEAIIADGVVLAAVAKHSATLGHPSLMREFLNALATGAMSSPKTK